MAKKLYEEASVQDIANAIREKNGAATKYKVAEMADAVRALSGSKAIEWHQCPEAVRNYLTNVTYDPSDYSTSQIANYAPATAVVSNYKPIGQMAGGVTHYNEVPNVLTPFASGGKAGTLKPLDALRWIRTSAGATAWNVRDLGGWACDGGTVKSSIPNGVFSGCTKLSTIYVPWSQGQVANAPWGASNATIIYDYKE